MNAGIYREGGTAEGLPLPRKSLSGLTAAIGVLAVVAVIMSPMLLGFAGWGHASAANAWRLMKDGGILWTGLVLLLDLFVPIMLAVLGAFVVRGKKIPTALLFAGAALPLLVGVFGAWISERKVVWAISGESVDPEQKIRIMAEGAAEAMANDMFAGFVACGCGIVACAAAASAAASIDTAVILRGQPNRQGGFFAAIALGGAWLFAALVLCVLRFRAAGPLVVFPFFAASTMVPFAILAGRSTAVLRDWHDRAEASRVLAALVIAGLCAALAVLALERAILATVTARALSAISGESVDPSQQARILVEAIDGRRFSTVALIVHGFFAIATFGAAALPAIGQGPGGVRQPMTANSAVAAVLGLALLSAAVGLSVSRESASRRIAESANDVGRGGVNLPTVRGTFSRKGASTYDTSTLVLTPNGATSETATGTCLSGKGIAVYADRAATVAQLAEALTNRGCEDPRLVFVARRDHDPALEARLGTMSSYLGTVAYVDAPAMPSPPVPSDELLEAREIDDDTIEVDGKRVPYPIPADFTLSMSDGRRFSALRCRFRPTDSIERMLRIVVDVRRLVDWHVYSSGSTFIDIGLIPKIRPFPSSTSGWSSHPVKSPSIRQGATQVNGRLPPEVIQRIVRQNFGRYRLCYERGLAKNPTLSGRVAVKFVIGRDGAVTSASDGGSDMTDKTLVSCVVDGFKSLTFPQPEGGIVTVVYPIIFNPGD